MNTDMNQYLILKYVMACISIIEKNDSLPCARLARSPLVLTEHIFSIDVSESAVALSI